MKNKPTLEEMEAAWRSQSARIEELAQTMPLKTPRHEMVVTLCRSVVAAALAVVLLTALPPRSMAAATPVGSLDRCRQVIDTIFVGV